jgi:hypothetical protein
MSKKPAKYRGDMGSIGMLSPVRFNQQQIGQLEEIEKAIQEKRITEKASYKYCEQVKQRTYRGLP